MYLKMGSNFLVLFFGLESVMGFNLESHTFLGLNFLEVTEALMDGMDGYLPYRAYSFTQAPRNLAKVRKQKAKRVARVVSSG